MTLSPDTIGMIIALFAFTVTVLGGVGAMLAHQSRAIDVKLEPRFRSIEIRLDGIDHRLDGIDHRLDAVSNRITAVEHELVDVKIAIARFEGPPRQLQHL